jgi:hypothetical protein
MSKTSSQNPEGPAENRGENRMKTVFKTIQNPSENRVKRGEKKTPYTPDSLLLAYKLALAIDVSTRIALRAHQIVQGAHSFRSRAPFTITHRRAVA